MSSVLLTGGAGFIGAHLAARLIDDGDDVRVFDNLRRGSREALDGRAGTGACEFIAGDIRDVVALREAMRGCDTVYHLAAQSNVIGALGDPDYSFTTNVAGTYNVLRAAVDLSVRKVVFTSSREVYGEATCLPVTEEHPLLAKNPYGASKLAGEAYCRTFANCYGLDVSIVRLANVYGPGDSGRVIPLWIARASAGEPLEVFGGEQIIDFIWVDTVVEALVMMAHGNCAGPVNVGSGVGTAILDLAARVCEVTDSAAHVVRLPARDAEVARFVADTTKMRTLGIEPPGDPLAHLPLLVEQPAALATT